ncbi:MAG: ATP-binding protein [Ilumatobacteraceae bacterium]
MVVPIAHERTSDMKASALDREQRSFEAVPASARAARRFVADSLRAHGATAQVVNDYVLVASELTSNIIEHGNGSSMEILIDASDPDWWDVEVVGVSSTTHEQLLRPETWTVAGTDEATGRGHGIVRHLMDEISCNANAGYFSVRCRRRRDQSV